MRLKFAEQQDRTEDRPVYRLTGLGILYSGEFATLRVEGVGKLKSRLRVERGVEHRPKDQSAAAERRLSTELFENQLLDGVIEHAPSGTNAGLSRLAGAPSHSNARREGLV